MVGMGFVNKDFGRRSAGSGRVWAALACVGLLPRCGGIPSRECTARLPSLGGSVVADADTGASRFVTFRFKLWQVASDRASHVILL